MHEKCRWVVGLLALVALPAVAAGAIDLEAEARRLTGAGSAEGAIELIEERSPEATRSAELWYLLADAYHSLLDDAGLFRKRGLANKMKRALHAALEIDPSHVDARRELADFYYDAPWIVGGSKDEASRQLDLLERVDPAHAFAVRARHTRDDGDRATARAHYRKALELDPEITGVRLALAILQQQDGDYPESIPLLDEAIARDPDDEKAYYYRARASAMSGIEPDRGLQCAESYLQHCTECDASDRGYGWWRRATLLRRLDRRDEAIEAYREALKLNPELDGAREALAELEQ